MPLFLIERNFAEELNLEQADAEKVLSQLDATGRWVTNASGQSITKTDGVDSNELFIESSVFIKNINTLTTYLDAIKKP